MLVNIYEKKNGFYQPTADTYNLTDEVLHRTFESPCNQSIVYVDFNDMEEPEDLQMVIFAGTNEETEEYMLYCGSNMRKKFCPLAKDFCREDCAFSYFIDAKLGCSLSLIPEFLSEICEKDGGGTVELYGDAVDALEDIEKGVREIAYQPSEM